MKDTENKLAKVLQSIQKNFDELKDMIDKK